MKPTIKIGNLSKQLRYGEIYYKLYHSPKRFIGRCYKRGFLNYYVDYREMKKMEYAVYSIPTIKKNTHLKPLKIYFLTGKKLLVSNMFLYLFNYKTIK